MNQNNNSQQKHHNRPKAFEWKKVSDVGPDLAAGLRVVLRLADGSMRAIGKIGKPNSKGVIPVETIPDFADVKPGQAPQPRRFNLVKSFEVQVYLPREKVQAIEEITESIEPIVEVEAVAPEAMSQDETLIEDEEMPFVPATVVSRPKAG
jgi:hypothetical protein